MDMDDIKAGALVRVPKGADTARRGAYLLHIHTAEPFKSGAVALSGEVRRLDGSPSERRVPWRTLVVMAARLETPGISVADLAPSAYGIRYVLNRAHFQRSVRLLAGVLREGFHVEQGAPGAVNVTWQPPPDAPPPPDSEIQAKLTCCAEAIEAAGWNAEMGHHGLAVTARGTQPMSGTTNSLATHLYDTYGMGENAIIAALPLRDWAGLYLELVPASGALMVLKRGRSEEDGDALAGLAVRDNAGAWYLGCIECRTAIEDTDAGMCLPCRERLAAGDLESQEAGEEGTSG